MAILKGTKSEIDVKVDVFGENNPEGAVVFMATFRVMKHSERLEWRKRTGELMRTTPEAMDQAKHLREYLVGWSGFPTSTGEELEFSEENRDMVLEEIDYCEALWAAFLSVINGGAKAKN